MDTFRVLGIPISATNTEEVIGNIVEWSESTVGHFICVREVPSLMASRENSLLIKVHEEADIVTPDGMPLVWMGRGLGYSVDRVCGPDLMHEICVLRSGLGLKHFFYGGKPGVAERLRERLQEQAPDLKVVGTYCPPFRELTSEEDTEVVKMIQDSDADIVWVGISSPRQDLWMWQHKDVLSQTTIGVGAAFDFLSGEVPRAPLWMQKRGLESVYRLISEPTRLWRRYLILVPKFLSLLVLENSFGTLLRGAMGARKV